MSVFGGRNVSTCGIAQVSALGSSEASAPQRFKCIGIMGSSNGATQLSALGAVSSLRRVRFRRFHCTLPSGLARVVQEWQLPPPPPPQG